MQSNVKLLLIEDNPAEARLLHELLKAVSSQQFHLTQVKRLKAAINKLSECNNYDVILLDLTLPDSEGLDSLSPLKIVAPQVPIVVLTNTNDEELAVTAVREGAQDYIVKRHLNTELLSRSLRYAIERKSISEALRYAKNNLEIRVAERTAELAQTNRRLTQEICERKAIEQELIHEKELAQVTLQSIGDAVITTDAQGYIQSLNASAEILTHCSAQKAKGKPLKAILKLFDETTNTPVEQLVTHVLTQGSLLEPLNHILLGDNDERKFAIELSIAPICLEDNQMIGTVLVCRDVTPARSLARQLAWQASHDALTNLANRREFERSLENTMVNTPVLQQTHTLCYLDLDQFKIVNDTCGHGAGDEFLRQVANLLQFQIRKTDLIARLGGDEFALLLRECSLAKGRQVAQNLIESIQNFKFIWQDKVFHLGVSIGLVEINSDITNSAKALSAADTAMYTAKELGGNRFHIYQNGDQDLAKRQGDMQWVSRIIKALEEDRFCLYSQLIAPIQGNLGHSNHYEILLRMQDEEGNLISPGIFLPAAERYNLMPAIDKWVISNFFKQLRLFLSQQPTTQTVEDLIYTVNLSGASLSDKQFFKFIQKQFESYQIPPQYICFEITETLAIRNLNMTVQLIHQVKELGCHFALDDFGSGMSSLTYLKNLPVDYLKIDGHFIKNIVNDPINATMVEAIHKIGHVMGLQTIAEFVENDAILEKLKTLGIDYAQGYGIEKPRPCESILQPQKIKPVTPFFKVA